MDTKLRQTSLFSCMVIVSTLYLSSSYHLSSTLPSISRKSQTTNLPLTLSIVHGPQAACKRPSSSNMSLNFARTYSTPKPKGLVKRVISFFASTIGKVINFILSLFKSKKSVKKIIAASPIKEIASPKPVETVPVPAPSVAKRIVDPTASTLSPNEIEGARKVVVQKLKEIETLEKTTLQRQVETQVAAPMASAVSSVAEKLKEKKVEAEVAVKPVAVAVAASVKEGEYADPATAVKLMIYEKNPLPPASLPPSSPVSSSSLLIGTVAEKKSEQSTVMASSAIESIDIPSASLLAEPTIHHKSKQSEEILKTFPAVVSDTNTDPFYLKPETGPVDVYSTLEGMNQNPFSFNLFSKQASQDDLLPVVDPDLLATQSALTEPVTVTLELPAPSKIFSKESLLSLKDKIKSAGISGTIAYIITEIGFWAANVPLILATSRSDGDQTQTLLVGAGILTLARFAVPFRLAVALGLTPIVEENITKRYLLQNATNKRKLDEPDVSNISKLMAVLIGIFGGNNPNGDI
jgi:hypothetical protein